MRPGIPIAELLDRQHRGGWAAARRSPLADDGQRGPEPLEVPEERHTLVHRVERHSGRLEAAAELLQTDDRDRGVADGDGAAASEDQRDRERRHKYRWS